MKLLYAYIKQFRNIREQEIYFSDGYLFTIDKSGVKVCRKESDGMLDTIYGDSLLKHVSVIVGKTGSGKTNILQLIGLDELSRRDDEQYLFIYDEETGTESLIMELHNVDLDIPVDGDRPARHGGNGMFRLTLDGQHVAGLVPISPENTRECLIVNCFDKHSFSSYPYNDLHQEGFFNNLQYLKRIISPYGRTNVGIACEWIQKYLSEFPATSIKRKASLVIKNHNFAKRDSSPVDEDLLKAQYWTCREVDEGFDEGFSRKVIDYSNRLSTKQKFLHDLLADYALYLRENLEAFYKSELERDADLGVFDGSIGLSDKINPFHSPDHWGHGSITHLIKRIKWLAMVTDRHYDGDIFYNGEGLVWQISSDIIDIYNLLAAMPDRYFSPTTFSIPIAEIKLGKGQPMEDLFERMTGYRPDEIGLFDKELLPYSITCLSSGEYQYAKVLGAIDEYCIRLKLTAQGRHDYTRPDFILLLDEPETFMHPELARRFMSIMDRILSKHSDSSKIQVIMTTHSPFMLSDVTSRQVTKLDFDENGYCIVKQNSAQTFAAGIHSIMANEFFLDFTIGEFSRKRLSKLLQRLKKAAETPTLDMPQVVKTAIDITPYIGDPMLRRYFESILTPDHDTSAF